MPLGLLRMTFHPGQHADGISLYHSIMYAILECALCLGCYQNCAHFLHKWRILLYLLIYGEKLKIGNFTKWDCEGQNEKLLYVLDKVFPL